MMKFEIFFNDLTKEAQERYFEIFKTSKEEENLEYIPLAIIEREIDQQIE